jgi:dihydrofolate synthase/folylpolyglutamate synthase
LFTSPHLERFTERICVNGVEIAEDAVIRLSDKILGVAKFANTFFEIVTVMAILHFAEEQVDIAVMEAGIGGRMDATNAVSGILSILTPLSMDHMEYLGDNVTLIAHEKIGIVKKGTPVVSSKQLPEVSEVFREYAASMNCPCFFEGAQFNACWEKDGLAYNGLGVTLAGVNPGIPGGYQLGNAATALCAAEVLATLGHPISNAALRKGIEDARWPGRMEILPGPPRFLLDGAHNPAGGDALRYALADICYERLIIVVGIMADKDANGVLSPLLPLADMVIVVTPVIERSMSSSQLAGICLVNGVTAVDAGPMRDGLARAREAAGHDDLIVVCGSLFAVGEARAILLSHEYEPYRG